MKNKVSLLFAGDAWIGDEVNKNVFSSELIEIIKRHDLAWINFEGPVAFDNDLKIDKAGPHLKQNETAINTLTEAGFGAFCLANNHIWDYGEKAFLQTKELLKSWVSIGAGSTQEEAYSEKIVEINNIKIGFLAFAEWGFGAAEENGGFAWVNHQIVDKKIAQVKKKVDFLVVQVHAGLEDISVPLPEWRQKYKEIIDLGADLIVGHHPHVIQPWEKYKNKYIFYSLGNCFFGKDDNGELLSVSVSSEDLEEFKLIPIISTRNGVRIDSRELSENGEMIDDKKYLEKVDKAIAKTWKERYRLYYEQVVTKNIWRKVGFNKTLLQHNLMIESHLWATIRALKMKELL